MQRALALDNSPPATVPLRFFYSAPLFLLLACALLLWRGPAALESRWTPEALALVHLLTLGALGHTMAGALMQILPVATNVRVLWPRFSAGLVHAGLALGTISLVAGFLAGHENWFAVAAVLLGSALIWLPLVCVGGWWRDRTRVAKGAGEILVGVRFALAALLITVLAGLALAGLRANSQGAGGELTDMHATWGLAGWVGVLVIAMSFQLIPLFQVTELYPRGMTRLLTPAVFGLLVLHSVLVFLGAHAVLAPLAGLLLVAAYIWFAVTTFALLWRRKRPEPDATTLFWRTAMLSLMACGPVWLAQRLGGHDLSVLLGVLFLVGFAWSAINGMLYKIIPFLTWFHCQRGLPVALPFIPKVRNIIPDARAQRQFGAHLAALWLLIGAAVHPSFLARTGALILLVSVCWLLLHMVQALHILLRTRAQVAQWQADRLQA